MNQETRDGRPVLLGKFFIEDANDGESYRTGIILDQVGPDHFLAQYDRMSGKNDGKFCMPMEVVCLDDLTAVHGDGERRWKFFETGELRQQYIDWVDAPAEPKVHLIGGKREGR